jgi:3-deoxy-D-manno-octulosonic-acid transferase
MHRKAAARRGSGPLLWIHAVSVGETRAAQPLVAALLERHPQARLLLTHMTPTGRAAGAELFGRFGERVVQAYLPYDLAPAQRAFLRAWRPSLGIVMETELWPNLCVQARRAGVPLVLVNARLSERSLRKGLRWRALTVPALRSLACVVAQTPADAQRIGRLGRADVHVAGNLKFDVSPAPALLARGGQWRAMLGARPVVLAASTRDGEEAALLDAWRPAPGGPLLVIVPRHPQRFEEVAAELARRRLRFARRAALDDPQRVDAGAIDVLLGDSMGEMFAWYAMADVAVLGGSLLPFGGQNLIEACAAGVPVVMGEHTFNFEDAAAQAIAAGAGTRVRDAAHAVVRALELLAEPGAREAMSVRGRDFAQAHRGATERTLALLAPWLPKG